MFSEGLARFKRGTRELAAGSRRKQSGQALVEYMILLTIVIGVVAVFLRQITKSFDKTAASYGARVEQQLRTGSAPPSIWNK